VGAGVPAGGTTGQVLKKASSTNYDTTWSTPTTALSSLTDVNLSTAPSNGQALVFDAASGKWKAGTGISGSLTTIAQLTLATPQQNIDFASIPNTFKDLIIEGRVRSSRAGVLNDNIIFHVGTGGVLDNSPSGTNYRLFVETTSQVSPAQDTNSTGVSNYKVAERACPAATADADVWGTFRIVVYDYANSAYWRVIQSEAYSHANTSAMYRDVSNGHWKNKTGAIDTVRVLAGSASFIVGSTFRLYGRN
jgi:hypothetical protein